MFLFIKQKIFEFAVEENFFSVASYLLKNKKIKLTATKSCSFRLAALRGHFNIVELLLNDKRTDPTDGDNLPLYLAHRNEHEKVVQLLFQKLSVKNKAEKEEPDFYNLLIRKRVYHTVSEF